MQATGCGKTHTISGTPEDPGLIFMAMKDLFQRMESEAQDRHIVIKLSYLEIYNEQIRDLLSPDPTPPGQGLQLRDSTGGKNRISVVGLTEHTPRSPEEVLGMITEGNRRRTMSPTEANAVSSRSHAVLQVNVMQRPKCTGLTEECSSASLNIIDLAGSERASATHNRGQRMMEGANINRSLLALANCINALCRPAAAHGQIHIPYRDSKLTRLLKFSLGGNCRTVMIVCVSPSSAHFEETQKTLKYANSAKSIRTKVSQNLINVDRHVESYAKAILELQAQNQRLKKLLEEGKSLESDVEQRKKQEMSDLVRQAKASMQDAASTYLAVVQEKAGNEAQLDAARVQATQIRSCLAERELQLRSNPSPAVDAEVSALKSALQRQENTLNDKVLVAGVRTLNAALTSLTSTLSATSSRTRLDSEAREFLHTWRAKVQAEGEAMRNKVRCETLLGLMSDQASHLPRRSQHVTVGTIDETSPPEDPPNLSSNSSRRISAASKATSTSAPASATRPRPGRTSISGKRLLSSGERGPARTTRRVPVAPRLLAAGLHSPKRASYAAATAASRTRRVGGAAESPRRTTKRNSLKAHHRRPSKEATQGKKISPTQAAHRMPPALARAPVSAPVSAVSEKRKVSLRWKDLAGEGELEERYSPEHPARTPTNVNSASVAIPHPGTPPPKVTEASPTSKHTLELSPTKSVAAKRLRPQAKTSAHRTATAHVESGTEPGVEQEGSMDSEPPTTSLLSPPAKPAPAAVLRSPSFDPLPEAGIAGGSSSLDSDSAAVPPATTLLSPEPSRPGRAYPALHSGSMIVAPSPPPSASPSALGSQPRPSNVRPLSRDPPAPQAQALLPSDAKAASETSEEPHVDRENAHPPRASARSSSGTRSIFAAIAKERDALGHRSSSGASSMPPLPPLPQQQQQPSQQQPSQPRGSATASTFPRGQPGHAAARATLRSVPSAISRAEAAPTRR